MFILGIGKFMFKLITVVFISLFSYGTTPLLIGTHYSPPWSDGSCAGAEIDIIKEAFSYHKIKIKCQYYSYGRLVKSFVERKVDFASPIAKFDASDLKVYYSDRFHEYVDVVISLKKEKISLDHLKGKSIVAYQGASRYHGDLFHEISKEKTYHETADRESQLKMLEAGRVDYIVGERNILKYIANNKIKIKVHTSFILKTWDVFAASHRKDLMEKFNFGLRKMKKKGRIKEIYKKYGIIH